MFKKHKPACCSASLWHSVWLVYCSLNKLQNEFLQKMSPQFFFRQVNSSEFTVSSHPADPRWLVLLSETACLSALIKHRWWRANCQQMACLNNGRKRAVVTFQNSGSCGDHLCVAWPEIPALRLFVLGWERRHENFHIYRHLRRHTAAWISGCGCCRSHKQRACFLKERLPSAVQLGHRQIPLHDECIIHKVARCDQHSFIRPGTLPPPAFALSVPGLSVGLLG